MSSRAQHYREAERILADLPELGLKPDRLGIERRILAVGEARAHAQLATMGDAAYSEYLDLRNTERLRESVASTPQAESRQWLIADEDDQG